MDAASETDDIVKEFLIESYEGLDQLDRDLVSLEHAPDDVELLNRVFRCIHTIKGTCGFLGFATLEAVTHVGENLLSKLREGDVMFTPALASTLLALVDAVRQMLASIESTGTEGGGDYSGLTAELTRLHDLPRAAAPCGTRVEASRDARVDLLVEALPVDAPSPAPAPSIESADAPGESRRGSVAETSIRVDVGLLDKLMTTVGELVLARNQILQYAAAGHQGTGFHAATQRLNLLTTELQEGVMKTRMQPIGNVWSKLPRLVRDLSVACGKHLRLEMEGRETELDKTIIEAIKDPLTHIVRNALDHGVELPEERVQRGKPAEGLLQLRAFHEGGQVNIEITDDGRGIDPDRLRAKAIERGLLTAEQVQRLSDREALNLIFAAGFSTAAAVTNISGRGVGMDVVRTNIERIGGTVDVHSTVGEGTTLRIKIPLTLAIIPALVVTCDGERYAIPQINLVELVRHETRDGGLGVEHIHGAPVYRLRGNLLPLVFLRQELQAASPADGLEAYNIAVLHADGHIFGLVVDEISDTTEIVVKPLSKHLQGISAYSGSTIMGDGRVALILDTPGLAQRAHVIAAGGSRALTDERDARDDDSARQTLLICDTGEGRRAAVPLSSVARLEVFKRAQLEWAGEYEVVQYRGQILPLLPLAPLIGGLESAGTGDTVPVVVYGAAGHAVGLKVDAIVDIVDEAIALERTVERAGVLGSAVVQQKVTDVLDIATIVRHAAPWVDDHTSEREAA
ncbi:MAG: chemotaxis protein CheA [Gemmatimonadetes bacterium]|nr:chemotaxis protein CheA [Gemmatimonadota bacterium]